VQFGLGELAEETARQSVKARGHYLLIVDSWGKICEQGLEHPEHHEETESREKTGFVHSEQGHARNALAGGAEQYRDPSTAHADFLPLTGLLRSG
jgi:hypothetical protein